MSTAIIVMGVSGCGKSTVASLLAQRLGLSYVDADTLHSKENIAKMAAGRPLADEDRAPWLGSVADVLAGGDAVVACSALRRRYRDLIRQRAARPVIFLYLHGDRDTLLVRMAERTGHYMPASLLDSQIATLEAPQPDEPAFAADIKQSPVEIVTAFEAWLKEAGR